MISLSRQNPVQIPDASICHPNRAPGPVSYRISGLLAAGRGLHSTVLGFVFHRNRSTLRCPRFMLTVQPARRALLAPCPRTFTTVPKRYSGYPPVSDACTRPDKFSISFPCSPFAHLSPAYTRLTEIRAPTSMPHKVHVHGAQCINRQCQSKSRGPTVVRTRDPTICNRMLYH
ncbi:hypothetical protein BC628DRAFT_930670 [Trametes gibbosa]|nr:hypothetical protein BC628DRAFT_930670 [Trametes gibbosa]